LAGKNGTAGERGENTGRSGVDTSAAMKFKSNPCALEAREAKAEETGIRMRIDRVSR
jgi:hypothetical protein